VEADKSLLVPACTPTPELRSTVQARDRQPTQGAAFSNTRGRSLARRAGTIASNGSLVAFAVDGPADCGAAPVHSPQPWQMSDTPAGGYADVVPTASGCGCFVTTNAGTVVTAT